VPHGAGRAVLVGWLDAETGIEFPFTNSPVNVARTVIQNLRGAELFASSEKSVATDTLQWAPDARWKSLDDL